EVSWTDETVAVWGLFYEQHRRQIIEIPTRRDLDKISFLASYERLHPGIWMFAIIDFGPLISNPDIIGMKIIVHKTVIVFDSSFQKQLISHRTELPPGCNITRWAFTRKLGQYFETLIEDCFLLVAGHGDRIFVTVAMNPDFMAGISDRF